MKKTDMVSVKQVNVAVTNDNDSKERKIAYLVSLTLIKASCIKIMHALVIVCVLKDFSKVEKWSEQPVFAIIDIVQSIQMHSNTKFISLNKLKLVALNVLEAIENNCISTVSDLLMELLVFTKKDNFIQAGKIYFAPMGARAIDMTGEKIINYVMQQFNALQIQPNSTPTLTS